MALRISLLVGGVLVLLAAAVVVLDPFGTACAAPGGECDPPHVAAPAIRFPRDPSAPWQRTDLPKGRHPHDVTAATAAGRWWDFDGREAARWDGERWRTSDVPLDGHDIIEDADVESARDIWLIAGGVLRRGDGEEWTDRPSPDSPSRVAVVSGKDVWVARRTDGDDVLSRWDGTAWRDAVLPAIPAAKPQGERTATLRINGLAADGQRVWAAGSIQSHRCCAALNHHRTVVLLWDAGKWRLLDLDLPGVEPMDVVPDGRGGAWVGADVWPAAERPRPTLLHFSGGTWRTVTLPAELDGERRTLSHLAARPGTTKVWAMLGSPNHDAPKALFASSP